jgi:O-antigen biosynthesis protein
MTIDNDWQKDYPNTEKVTEDSLDDNSSLKKMLDLVGDNKDVVDFGCATGYLSKLLQQRGCTVTGVEINVDAGKIAEKYCEQVLIADLDFVSIEEILTDRKFDVAIFGDVLEHLRNPYKILKETKQILKKDGYIVASIPNIAHAAIRLSLLQGKFEYTDLGILDNTHLKFFTRKTVKELFEKTGYLVEIVDCTKLDCFSKSTLIPQNDRDEFNIDIIKKIEEDKDCDTLQFIIRSYPCPQYQLQQAQLELQRAQSKIQQVHTELESSKLQLQQTQVALIDSQNTIRSMETSKFWKLRTTWFKLKHKIGIQTDNPESVYTSPHPNRIIKVLKTKGLHYAIAKGIKKIYQKINNLSYVEKNVFLDPSSFDTNYKQWLDKNSPRKADLMKMAETLKIFNYHPVISIIMPVFNTPEFFLRAAIDSVINQIYPYWELCIADDASTQSYVNSVLKEYIQRDSRVKVIFRKENGHISVASNSALDIATGEFVALLDHDDLLTPDALYEVALLLNKHPHADMIYSDEDKLAEDGTLEDPFFKPDWCPDSFLSRMYTSHLGTYRRSLVNDIGRFRVGYEGSQDYDLVLRLTERTDKIFHIAKVLYHWRIHFNSTAKNLNSKTYTSDAAKRAIADAIDRRNEPGRVVPISGGHHIVRYTIKDFKLVSIIIPTRNLGGILDKCLSSIFEKTIYPNYEVLVIDNGSDEIETLDVIDQWNSKEPSRFRCEILNIDFNYPKINNYAVTCAKGDYLLFLNNDTEIVTNDWLDAMVEQAQRPSIGTVGALLLYPDNTIQHAGIVQVGEVAGHSHKHYPPNSNGYFNQIQTINNYSALTAACLMCRREVFESVGGFEEKLTVAFNDVDLCLKIVAKGYKNVYLPHVIIYHYESKSRGYEDTPEKQARFIKEINYMRSKWEDFVKYDPCYSSNLTREAEDFSIRL